MKKSFILGSLLTGAAVVCPVAALADAPRKPQFGYFLTKTHLAIQVRQTLAACPDAADDQPLPEIETEWEIGAAPVADTSAYVNVDASHGFLAKRSTALKLRANGTLVSFDSETSGQGGAVINAVLKVASSIFLPGVAIGGSKTSNFVEKSDKPVLLYKCKDEVVVKFAAISSWSQQIASLEDKILLGTATAADIQLLERRKEQRAAVRESLILTADSIVIDLAPTTKGVDMTRIVEALNYSDWFERAKDGAGAFDPTKIVGYHGFQIGVKSPESPFPGDGTTLNAARAASPRLVYRRPVAAVVSATPCAISVEARCKTSTEGAYAAATVSDKILVPQFSGLYSLSTGRGGLFGSRQASATFDEYGAPIEISYGSDSGAADIASSITAAGDATATLRDSELTALERQIKLEEARKKLRDLRSPPATE